MERLTERNKKGCAYFNNDGILIRGANGTFHQKKDITAHYIHDRFVALDKVIDRLAAYEDTGLTPEEIMALVQPPNDQLTLEELREMDGEPVWVVPLNDFDILPANYLVNAYAEQIVVDKFGAYLDFEDYGKTWLAYRRKPEEGMV